MHNMKLYLFRHGEKASPFHPNPPLSEFGMQQAMALSEKVQIKELPRPQYIWASPRLRSQQSFQALSDSTGVRMEVRADLDERQMSETHLEFRERITSFLRHAEIQNGVIFACSHADWLEAVLALIPCDTDLDREIHSHWSPLQYVALQLNNGIFEFIESKRVTP